MEQPIEEDKLGVRSVYSGSTRSSSSQIAMAAVEARAKAEAARARAEFARKEIDLRRKQAEVNAKLEALREEKNAEAALAEASVFEAAAAAEDTFNGDLQFPISPGKQGMDIKQSQAHIQVKLTPQSLSQLPAHAENYSLHTYLKHSSDHRDKDPNDFEAQVQPMHSPRIVSPVPRPALPNEYQPHTHPQDIKAEFSTHLTPVTPTQAYNYNYESTTPAQPRSFAPYSLPCQPNQYKTSNGENEFANMARYLSKRDLVIDGLTKFTDTAEDYWAWKASFYNTTEG